MAEKWALEARGLSKIYQLDRHSVYALKEVSFKIKEGDFTAVQGPSGSGKTTLLNLLGGLERPTAGEVWIDGHNITTLGEGRLAEIRLRKVGFVFQFYNLISGMTSLRNVELPMLFAKIPGERRRLKAKELLELVGLGERLNHKPHELSGGEQQRVAIARALALQPAIVLMDEPTGNLDEETTKSLIDAIIELNRQSGQTFLLATHNRLVAECAKGSLHLRNGTITLS